MNSRATTEALSRRLCLKSSLLVCGVLSAQKSAWAGGQLEEPLIDSVRTALSSAVHNSSPPVPEFASTDARLKYLRWLGATSERL
jgi:hypothetical protein